MVGSNGGGADGAVSPEVVGGADTGELWRAVLERDRSYDEAFVYAVRTTGIFCRPSCPSRKPRRENVELHPDARSALEAGFRPCRRCRPVAPTGTPTDASVRQAIDYLEEHVSETVTLERLGEVVGLSPSHLQRTFKERVGVSPKAYQDARRLERFRRRVREGDSVSRAGYGAGFSSSRALYERADDGLGMTPGRYRSGAPGLRIRYTIVASELGRLMVAATDRGVCAVSLGDDDSALAAGLESEFPGARIRRDDQPLAAWATAIALQAAGSPPGRAVPADLHGTVFQMRVWDALRNVPLGETRSYGEIAAALGIPDGARAVASACAANRAALVVPCHRVVRADGAPGGYRWGVERKRSLLASEAHAG